MSASDIQEFIGYLLGAWVLGFSCGWLYSIWKKAAESVD